MKLDEKQGKDLDNINDKLSKSDYLQCHECKAHASKGYCGGCDNWYFRVYHKPNCSNRDWFGTKDCACERYLK